MPDTPPVVPYATAWTKSFKDISQRTNISWNSKAVLSLLTHYQIMNPDQPVVLGYRDMAHQLGMDRNTARRCARDLETRGEVRILPRKKQANQDYDCPREFLVISAEKRNMRRNKREERAIREGKLTPMVAK